MDPNNPEDRKKLQLQAEIEKRKKDILVQKATRELIDDVKKFSVEKYSDDPVTLNSVLTELDNATSENEQYAREHLKTTENEIKNSTYNTVSKEALEKYEIRLKNRGITDEDVHDRTFNGEKKSVKSKAGKKSVKTVKKDDKKTLEKVSVPKKDIVDNNVFNESKNLVDDFVKKENVYEDFDPNTIPANVQYDIIPLPSNGECYPSKKNRIPVAYLTAADENIMASPNIARDGKIIELILKRKILDKTIKVEDLCDGDIEAIVLWLRMTSFGPKATINTRNPDNGNVYETEVDLSQFKYKDFNLKGDENGLFDYITDSGTHFKFRFLNRFAMSRILEASKGVTTALEKQNSFYCLEYITRVLSLYGKVSEFPADELRKINECIYEIDTDAKDVFSTVLTDTIAENTISINGNTDRDFIKSFIENMNLSEFKKYRAFISENEPGVDTSITVDIPESDGGGSFETFLRIKDTFLVAD